MTRMTFDPKARANEIAAQLKAAEEAKAAYDAAIDTAVKNAGRTRAEFVEMLYDYFGIEPEVTERKNKTTGEVVVGKDGTTVKVKTDRDESIRIEKLARAFERLVERAEDGNPSSGDRPTPVTPMTAPSAPFGQKERVG